MGSKTLIWTRAAFDWADDVKIMQPLMPKGIELLHVPCIATHALPLKVPDGLFDCGVILSASTVRYAVADKTLRARLAALARIYTHGSSTAAHMKEVGLKAEFVDVRTADVLAKHLRTLVPRGSRILWPTAAEPSFDLQGDLAGHGMIVTRLDCYKTTTGAAKADGTVLTKTDIEVLTARLTGVVAFASPSAVRGFVDVFKPSKNRLRKALTAVVIGPTTAKAAEGAFDRIESAANASAEALIRTAVDMTER